ncbi:RNA polymerase sigma-54 factor [Dissulfurispira thermophila]|uniref:RNA polymerase sigma-54 factor n=2 Tax=root TaxID=1 RepID=A0A7G1H448_9BACT|nr:RNA polymerase factor sigma-54 [Dissulfurispira thermophila]BCB96959.1 RNA polymerase sigma-54 factor [Dissulfurispira thermophila]
MALESRLDLKLSQKLILTPQLQQAIKLLQMPQIELAQTLNNELVENPFLEEEIEEPEMDGQIVEDIGASVSVDDTEIPLEGLMNFSVDEYFEERGSDGRDLGYFAPDIEEQPSYEIFFSKKLDLYDHLLWQLRLSNAPDRVRIVAEVVIGNIDEDGYLRATEDELISSTDANIDTVKSAVELVQGFDPPGVGARNLKECLLLQLKALNLSGTLIEKIIVNNMEDLQKKKYNNIARQYNSPIDDIIAAVKIIEGLNPRPATSFSSVETNYIVPDVFITKSDEGYQIILNEEGMPRLRLNNSYRKLLLRKESLTKEEREFLKEKLRLATELIKSLDQRNKTIYKVSESILKFQRDFFDKGVQFLKPLNLRDVASDINMHESTVSRVTSNKFLACSHGVFSFRFFFSSAIHSDNGQVSSTFVKDIIKRIISEEDPRKPLSDQMITDMLKKQNIIIARRTVAKYREELKIPPQNQRKIYE